MSYDNPNGAATMPLYAAAEQSARPQLTGGLAARLFSSMPLETCRT